MIDPKKIAIITPTRDGQVCTEYAGGLASCAGMYGALSFVTGMSVVSLARNIVVHSFLQHDEFDHLVMIDSDIGFSKDDLQYLLEERMTEDSVTTHQIVVAEYGKRPTGIDNNKDNAQFGLGFTRVHRSVFEQLREVATSDGDLMVNAFMWQGEMMHDYFPCGATPQNHWMSEDHGFFMLCRLAEIQVRVETRTNLLHWGRTASFHSKNTELQLPELPKNTEQ